MAFVVGLVQWWRTTPTTELIWIGIGLIAQLMFSMRFLVQWIATEKARASTMPESFWYFRLFGGVMLLAYACYRVDPVFILGQESTRATSTSFGFAKREADSVTIS